MKGVESFRNGYFRNEPEPSVDPARVLRWG
jgi:hypothetical protein